MELATVIAVIALALVFDYTNGFHDAANAIATSVSTRALTPRVALLLAAVMNFVGAFLGTKVAQDRLLRSSSRPTASTRLVVVFAALVGAITWNLITWYFGLPSSSSHALIGGLVGAGAGRRGDGAVGRGGRQGRHPDVPVARWSAGARLPSLMVGDPLAVPAQASPGRPTAASGWRRPSRRPRWRWATACRTPQKTMGVIVLALVVGGYQDSFDIPLVGRGALGRRDLAGHLLRRLADHAHPRPADHRDRPAARLRRRDDRLERALHDGVRVRGARSRRPRRSPARSWASARPSGRRPVRWGVAGNILVAWVLTIPAPPWSPPSSTSSTLLERPSASQVRDHEGDPALAGQLHVTGSGAGRRERSAEAAGDVVLGALVAGVAEDLRRVGRTRPAGRAGSRARRRPR